MAALLVDEPPDAELPDDDFWPELLEDDEPSPDVDEDLSPELLEGSFADAPDFSFDDSLVESFEEPDSPEDPEPERLSLR